MASVLIIDDDRSVCDILSNIINGMGHCVTCSHTLCEGLGEAVNGKYDLILLDVGLPDGNAQGVIARIQQAEPRPQIIIITSPGDGNGAELAIRNGVWDYIQQPASVHDMTLPIIRALQYCEEGKAKWQGGAGPELPDLDGITSRTQAEKALRESAWFQQQLIDALPVPVFIKDPEGRYLGCNKAFESFLNRGKDEIIGKSVSEIAPGELADIYREKDLALLSNSGVQIYESSVRDADGLVRNVVFHKATFSKPDGSVGGLIGAVLDLSERKRAEEDLRASEERYRLIFDYAPLGILHFDQTGTVRNLNDKFAEIVGASKEKILGFNMLEGVRDPVFLQAVKDAIDGGFGYYEGEYLSVLGGKTTPLSAIYKRISTEDGKFSGAVGIFEDITERKRAEKELRDSEQQLRSIIQGYPLPAFVIGKDHRVLYWNKALEEMSKIKADEVAGTDLHWRAFYGKARPCMADLLVDEAPIEVISHWYNGIPNKSSLLEDAYETTEFFPELGGEGNWLHCVAAAIRNSIGTLVGAIETLEDISDRKKAEEVLRESENRYRAIFENTGAATFIVEEDTIISLANAEFEKLTGYTRDEVENKRSWTEFVVKEDLEKMLGQHHLRRTDAKAALKQYEFRLIDRHDQTRNCLLTVDMIADTKRSIASFFDITERKKAEEALISANRQLNDIIEFLPDATLVIDKDDKVIAWNRAIEEMTGISKDEMIGKGDRAYSVPFFGDRRPNLLIDARDEELESRYRHVWKKGGIQYGATYDPSVYGGKGAYLFATGAPLYDAHGNRAGAIESIRDVTEQRQAEEALRQSEEKYRELVENANSIILRMDYMGNVTFFNEFAQGFFGYSEEEIMGKNVVGTIVPPVESTTGRDLQLMVEDIAVNPERYAGNINENMRRGGERVWIAWTNKPIRSENGRVMETLCVGNDITERKQAEEELKHSEERFKVFFECAPDPYYLIDLQGNFLDGNKAAEEAIGYKREELIGKNLFEANLLLPEDIPMAREQFARNILGYPSGPDEFVLNRKDGKQVFLEIRAFPTVIREQHLVLCIARDITRRKQIEETLRDRETRLRAITDSARDAILMMDPEGMITYWNPAAERILGYTREEISGQNLHRLIAPQRYHAAHNAGFSMFVETGLGEAIGKTLELVARRKDGEEIPVELSLSSVFMNGWQAVGLLRDITKRKQAEEALKRANLLLFTQNETSIDGIMAVDENDTIISSNQRFADMWGISREVLEAQAGALVLRSVSDKVMDPQAFLQRVGYLYAHRNETSLEEIALKDGRTFERYSAPMNGTDGRYHGRVSYFRDITERKLMEEAVVEAEAKYRGIFENALMGIFQSTPEGRLLSLNMAFARILGYDSPEEILNTVRDISQQIYANPERRSELIRLIEEKEMVQDFEVQIFRKDMSIAWIMLNIRAVHDVNGKIIRMEGTAQDITESKRLASQLNQAQKMEAIGTLAGGIAHDFNNILMPIIGYSELSLNAVPQGSRLHHNIEQVLLSSNRAKELVKQILTFSRKREQERRPVQVSLLVKETLKLLRSSLPSTIEIRQDIGAGAIEGTTMADSTQIHQVLMNLCTNAAHAMGEKGGVMSINLKDVDINSAAISGLPDLAPGSYLKLSVADTGHGMDEAVRQRIFDPYFTTKGPSKGTGLGLSLVYGIITSLSGGIAVFSEPGQGTTFDVYFPRTKTLQAPMVEALEPIPTGKGLVLVVDDEQSIVDMLKQMLESLGYDVAARYSSSDALHAFGARPDSFDLVISDMTMPNMTGIVLAREILKIRPDTPIILCTGFSEAVDENRAKLLGIKEFLMKPVALRDLATTVKKILLSGQTNNLTFKADQGIT